MMENVVMIDIIIKKNILRLLAKTGLESKFSDPVFFIFVGLLITANPYLAVNIYPSNQNFWQDYYEPMASLRYFSVLTKNSLCSNSFAST